MTAADLARSAMVDALRDAGRLRTPEVDAAFRAVPRHLFLPGLPVEQAYADEAVAVQHVDGVATSSASQPSMMAIMLEQLDLRPGHRVLEVGAGTGYNAALMARIVGPAGAVTAVDIDAELVERAQVHLAAAGVTGVGLHCADGVLGHPDGAPYDRIVLTVGSDDVRPGWVDQLATGGRLLLPLAVRDSQLSVALDLCPDGLLRSRSVRSCAFIRLRGAGAGPPRAVELGDGLSMQAPGDAPVAVDPAAVAAALAAPGADRPSPVRLAGPVDVWDGAGLHLALTEPGALRLLAADPGHPLAGDMLRVGTEFATLALADAAGSALAVAVVDAAAAGPDGRCPTSVRAHGTGGTAAADRMLAALARWSAAGAPTAGNLHLTVVPQGRSLPAATGGVVVRKRHCTVLVGGWSR